MAESQYLLGREPCCVLLRVPNPDDRIRTRTGTGVRRVQRDVFVHRGGTGATYASGSRFRLTSKEQQIGMC